MCVRQTQRSSTVILTAHADRELNMTTQARILCHATVSEVKLHSRTQYRVLWVKGSLVFKLCLFQCIYVRECWNKTKVQSTCWYWTCVLYLALRTNAEWLTYSMTTSTEWLTYRRYFLLHLYPHRLKTLVPQEWWRHSESRLERCNHCYVSEVGRTKTMILSKVSLN